MKRTVVSTAFLASFLLSSLVGFAQSQSRSDILKEIKAKRAEVDALEELYILPSEEDRLRYAEFLQLPDTGIIRLLPRERFDSAMYKDIRKSMQIRGGGAYYSFLRRTHEYGYGSDLSLERNLFQTGFAGADYGMLTDIGDVAIENVMPDNKAVYALGSYRAAREEQVARNEYQKLGKGAEINGTHVCSRVPVKLNSTYLLRSINFLRSDVLVAFKVVRIDSDGSATLVWKIIKKFSAPKLNSQEPTVIG
ncbi:MAG TPA: hypothetical protein VGQ41_10845 [Pyrinomonadaceae bacterium]|jgi:hypothetical protein|nr:hypothetical protein [Pyrinomonadaceae bacterium]